ncbi:MAG: sigma 54-interacting transcriptional regulator [Blastocatellia bacterium]|nr:sigma 54-interacting transcriptional regulator [Blastocatellia bacterium]
MSKNIHDLAKSLRKGKASVGRIPEPQPFHSSSITTKMRERTSVWLLIEALHQNKLDIAESILLQSNLTDTERLLLRGINEAWKEEYQRAENLLTRASSQAIGVDKCWAHLELATLYQVQEKNDLVDFHISRARRYAREDRQDRQCMQASVELLDVRVDIERGASRRALKTIFEILEECTDSYLKGIANYLLGCLGRFQEEIGEEIEGYGLPTPKEALERAYHIFHTLDDHYFVALTKLELASYVEKTSDASELANWASKQLKLLGRSRESSIAEVKAKEFSQKLQQELKVAKETKTRTSSDDRVGQCLFISAPMKAIRFKLNAIAAADNDPVLILGPRGSGKEMLAQAIHMLSPRSHGSMLAINCGALPENLVESELFGYEKGAFTGANTQKKGLFELAHGGTILLDEIGELPATSQSKLLRVLQTGRFRRVGGTVEVVTNARVIAATNRDLDMMAREGTFRDDLLDRLSVWRLSIPPLNRRREEILPLAEEFLARYGDGKFSFDNSAKKFLLEKDYPGNVRVLENDVRRSIGNAKAAETYVISASMICEDFDYLPELAANSRNLGRETVRINSSETTKIPSFDDIPNYEEAMLSFERELLIRALVVCKWNKKLASTALGMSERTFWRAVQRHKLHSRPDDVEED